MSVIVAGTYRLPPDKVVELKPHAVRMVAASCAEDGCAIYSHAEDVTEAGLMRFFEIWRDDAALRAHGQAPHMKAWRAAGDALGVTDRQITVYQVSGERRV